MGILNDIWPYVAGLLPTLGLLWLFYFILKNMLEGDRKERAAIRRWEKERAGENSAETRPTVE